MIMLKTDQMNDLKKLIALSNQFYTEVLPQAGKLVLQDFEMVNELGLLLNKLSKEHLQGNCQ